MKVAIVGGSAPSTPHMLADPRLAGDDTLRFALHGRSARHLGSVLRASEMLDVRLRGRIETTTELDHAVDEADVVIVQARIGGLGARAHDERFPLDEGIPGDEGLGPGGFAAAWRTWPALHAVLAAVAGRAPRAHVALLTAPLGLLVRCARAAFPALDVAGLCELPSVVLGEIRHALGEPASFAWSYAGVNHIGWFTALAADGRDRMIDYAATRRDATYPDAATIAAAGGVPLPYVRLIDEPDAVVAAQRAKVARGDARAAVLAGIADAAYDAFERGDAAAIRDALARRPAPWYAHAVAPWVRAHADAASEATFFLTARNDGYLRGVDDDAIVEVPHRMCAARFVAEPPPPRLPPHVARTLHALIAYEAYASAVVAAHDERAVSGALARHPWVPNGAIAERLSGGVLSYAPGAPAAATAAATSSA